MVGKFVSMPLLENLQTGLLQLTRPFRGIMSGGIAVEQPTTPTSVLRFPRTVLMIKTTLELSTRRL